MIICGAAFFAFGCTPHIGDDCTVSTNCSASGDRLCDITEPGGYCTIFNCEPDSCPDNAICVNFGTQLSSVGQCAVSQGNSPYQRSFCMAACGSDGDCRAGYSCLDLSGKPNPDGSPSNTIGAVAADYTRSSKVCTATNRAADPELRSYDGGTLSNEVCSGSDAGPALATGGAGDVVSGDSGAGGAAGASGAGG